jgi:hypothetical protein
MSKISFLSEATVDMILRALGAGGFLPNNADRESIRAVDPNLTELARDNLAASFAYGGGGSADRLSSAEDCWVIIDNDGFDAVNPYQNFFNIVKGQPGVPVTNAQQMLFSIGAWSGPDTNYLNAAFGPRLAQVGFSDDMGSRITFGAGGDGFNKWDYGTLTATQTLLQLTANPLQTGGLRLNGGPYVTTFASISAIIASSITGAVRGGWYDVNSNYRFVIGDPGAGMNTHSLMIEKEAAGSYDALKILSLDTGAERQIYITGSYHPAPDAGCKWIQVAIGGQPGVTGQQPNNVPIEASDVVVPVDSHLVNHKATCLVVSPDRGVGVSSCGLQIYHRASAVPNYTTLFNMHSEINLDNGALSPTIRLFSVTGRNGGGLRTVAFAVSTGDAAGVDGGTAWARSFSTLGGYNATGLDVAERFETDSPGSNYVPGTVMVSAPSGKVCPSDSCGDPGVVGAVSTKPGVRLGRGELDRKYDPARDREVFVGMTGTVPVRVSAGPVRRGNLLVSGINGTATKAPADPVPGTVLGKALSDWDGTGPEGKVRMLIIHR